MKKRVTYPLFTRRGITANHRSYPLDANLRVMGADTETCRGSPMTLQASDGEGELFEYVKPETIFPTFRDWVLPRCRSKGVNVCYVHFLRFDLPVIFFEKRLALYEQGNEFEFELHGCKVKGLFGKVNKFDIEADGKKLQVLDSWAFTQAGLDASLKMYKIGARKKKKPRCRFCLGKAPYCAECRYSGTRLGWVRYDTLPPGDWERLEFEAYAKGDASSLQKLGESIMGFHKRYTVRPSISLPQFASRVFRHHFMEPKEVIPPPPPAVIVASEASYHGGMNWAPPECPLVVEGAREADINGAYAHAMKVLPQFVQGFYARVEGFDEDHVGVYKVTGEQDIKYPIIYSEAFEPIHGKFSGVWITGHELARARRVMDLKIEDGWIWAHDKTYRHNPLAEYVDHFYGLKEKTDRASADYYFYKTCSNALYGKFCAAVEHRERKNFTVAVKGLDKAAVMGMAKSQSTDYTWDDVTKSCVKIETTHRAGLLTNFFIASQVTGHVRAQLWDLLTQYDGFHAATDAIKTVRPIEGTPGLGGLKIETEGRCYVFRNKLYLHFAESTKFCGHKRDKKDEEGNPVNAWRYELHDEGQHLCKYGLHGFKGKVRDLYAARKRLLKGESYAYSYGHMVGLREGFKRRDEICSWKERSETLRLSPSAASVGAKSSTYVTSIGNAKSVARPTNVG